MQWPDALPQVIDEQIEISVTSTPDPYDARARIWALLGQIEEGDVEDERYTIEESEQDNNR